MMCGRLYVRPNYKGFMVQSAILQSCFIIIIIIIIHEFHGDTSLKQIFRAAVNVTY